jgi:hypothetical protein
MPRTREDARLLSQAAGRRSQDRSIVDEHARECPGGRVDRSITRDALVGELDRPAAKVDQLPGPAAHLCTWTVT